MAGVTFDNVTKTYGDGFLAVSDLNLDVHDGEFVVLVGPSGCGKSTALRMLAGLEEIADGDAPDRRARRQRPAAARARHRDGLPELRALPAHDGRREHRLRPAHAQGAEGGGARAGRGDRRASRPRSTHLDRKPKQLSGGQRQRVAMGRAIVREPQVFLMDEPLSNLDAKLRVQMRAEISRIQRELGVTTIYVTHDQVEAMTMGDRVAVMREGVLQQFGPPQELYDRPANLFVAELHRLARDEPVRGHCSSATDDASCAWASHRSRSHRAPRASRSARRGAGRTRYPARALVGADVAEEGQARLRGEVKLVETLGSERSCISSCAPPGSDRRGARGRCVDIDAAATRGARARSGRARCAVVARLDALRGRPARAARTRGRPRAAALLRSRQRLGDRRVDSRLSLFSTWSEPTSGFTVVLAMVETAT